MPPDQPSTAAAPSQALRLSALLLAGTTLACGGGGPTVNPGSPTSDQSVYTFGAKFEPPTGRVVHGMGQWLQYNAKLVALLPPAQQPAAELLFIDIGDTPRGWRPQLLTDTLRDYDAAGFIPHLDLALRGLQPPRTEIDTLPDPLFGIDDEIATTTRYDARINDLIQVVRDFRKPILLRIGGEFSGWWNGYHPYAYPRAFRKIVGMFRAAGVDNVAFVWCYEPAAPGDFDERSASGEFKWYPGADVIDWFSIDWFNTADFTGPLTGGRGGNELTPNGRSRKFLDMAVAVGKPVIIAESAPADYDLADAARAGAAWNEWFVPYFQVLSERPEIKWFHLVSFDWTQSSFSAANGWKNNDVTASPLVSQQLLAELAKPRYLHQPEKALLKDYTKYH